IGQTGTLMLTGASTVTAATMSNSGLVYIGSGATVNLTNQLGGITDVVAGSQFILFGTFNDILGGANAFASLNSVEGTLNLYGQNFTDTPASGTLTIASSGALTA